MRKIIKSIIFLMFFASLVMNVSAQQSVVDEVVWVVGDEAILKSQVEEQRLRMQYEGEKINGDPYCVIPEQIAIQKLFMHQAKIDSIIVSESQVLQQVESRINYFVGQMGSKEKMEEYFNKTSSQLRDEMRDMIREQLTVQQMQAKLVENIKTTPSDVRRFISNLSEDSIPFIPTQVEVQMISFEPKIPQTEIENIKSRLREYTERVNKGETEFSTLAILYSEDPGSARNGGELGFMGKGQLVPEYANVAFNLNDTKKVSKIVESEFGFHIIQMIEKRGDRINSRHILLKPKVSDKDKKDALHRLDSLRTDILANKFTFDEAALYVSHDKNTRNNNGLMTNPRTNSSKFEMEQLPQEIAKVVYNLKPGEISAPFIMVDEKIGKEVCVIVKLKNRINGHKANIGEDYQALKSIYESKIKADIINQWIKKKQADTYVRIREGWRNCEFQYPGWIKN